MASWRFEVTPEQFCERLPEFADLYRAEGLVHLRGLLRELPSTTS